MRELLNFYFTFELLMRNKTRRYSFELNDGEDSCKFLVRQRPFFLKQSVNKIMRVSLALSTRNKHSFHNESRNIPTGYFRNRFNPVIERHNLPHHNEFYKPQILSIKILQQTVNLFVEVSDILKKTSTDKTAV